MLLRLLCLQAVFGRPEKDAAILRQGLGSGQDQIKPKLPVLPALACGQVSNPDSSLPLGVIQHVCGAL